MLRQRSVKRLEFRFDQKAVHWIRYSLNKLNNFKNKKVRFNDCWHYTLLYLCLAIKNSFGK